MSMRVEYHQIRKTCYSRSLNKSQPEDRFPYPYCYVEIPPIASSINWCPLNVSIRERTAATWVSRVVIMKEYIIAKKLQLMNEGHSKTMLNDHLATLFEQPY